MIAKAALGRHFGSLLVRKLISEQEAQDRMEALLYGERPAAEAMQVARDRAAFRRSILNK